MLLTYYQVYNLSKFISFLGGLWTVISVVFGAIIFSILRMNFWNQLAITMLKREMEHEEKLKSQMEIEEQISKFAINDDGELSECSCNDEAHHHHALVKKQDRKLVANLNQVKITAMKRKLKEVFSFTTFYDFFEKVSKVKQKIAWFKE